MANCRECQKNTIGVLVSDDNQANCMYIPNLCQNCMWKQSPIGKPSLRCRDCSAPCYMTVSGRCQDCYLYVIDLVTDMEDIDPIDPPLGYNLIGWDDIQAEMEVSAAYNLTPAPGELEN